MITGCSQGVARARAFACSNSVSFIPRPSPHRCTTLDVVRKPTTRWVVIEGGGEASVEAGRRHRGGLEHEVIAVLAAAGEAMTPGQVRDALGAGLAYTTVMTVLTRL